MVAEAVNAHGLAQMNLHQRPAPPRNPREAATERPDLIGADYGDRKHDRVGCSGDLEEPSANLAESGLIAHFRRHDPALEHHCHRAARSERLNGGIDGRLPATSGADATNRPEETPHQRNGEIFVSNQDPGLAAEFVQQREPDWEVEETPVVGNHNNGPCRRVDRAVCGLAGATEQARHETKDHGAAREPTLVAFGE